MLTGSGTWRASNLGLCSPVGWSTGGRNAQYKTQGIEGSPKLPVQENGHPVAEKCSQWNLDQAFRRFWAQTSGPVHSGGGDELGKGQTKCLISEGLGSWAAWTILPFKARKEIRPSVPSNGLSWLK